MWRVAGLRVRSPSPPRATRSYASRLVLFFTVRSGLPSRRFRDFWTGARNRSHCVPSGRLARQSIDLFVSPRGSMTIQRQLVEPASLVPHTRLARTQRRCGSVRERKRPRAPSSADNAARGSTRPIDGRTFLRRVVSPRLGSIERVHATFPGEASKAVRCGPAKPHARRPAVVA